MASEPLIERCSGYSCIGVGKHPLSCSIMHSTLTIYEEETNLLWGLAVVVAAAFATYLLGDAFLQESLLVIGFRQLLALTLFVLAFVGILKITDPLYRFELQIEGEQLVIEAYKGEELEKTLFYDLHELEELRFAPKTPTSKDDALFDFSPNYFLIYRSSTDNRYRKLIDLGNVSFTLKVPDIARIIRFIRRHNPSIHIPGEQEAFLK